MYWIIPEHEVIMYWIILEHEVIIRPETPRLIITEGKVVLSNLKHLTNLSYPKHWTPFTPH